MESKKNLPLCNCRNQSASILCMSSSVSLNVSVAHHFNTGSKLKYAKYGHTQTLARVHNEEACGVSIHEYTLAVIKEYL